MFFRARRTLRRAWFNFNCRGLLKLPPLHTTDNSLTIVTMLCHGEVTMYLLAVRSFCQQLGRAPAIVVLNDGSLTYSDKVTLRRHLPEIRIVVIADVPTAACPKGSCWERLLLISDIVQDGYVVQLDSDTLTSHPIPEVIACIAENRSFTLLGDRSFPEIEPMLDAWERLKGSTHHMVQAVCERAFNDLPEAAELRYLRGNAGFAGFAKGSIDRVSIVWFSDLMRRVAKDQWDEWGSEQVTSNLLIANTEDALPLPFPKYLSYWAHKDVPYETASFIHFIGPFRFAHGFYLRKAKGVIKKLKGL